MSVQNAAAAAAEQINDPAREFADHVCRSGEDGCAGDARLYQWESGGYGIVQPVYYTARDGATISGHMWAGCPGLSASDGVPGVSSYLVTDTTVDTGTAPPNAPYGTGIYPKTASIPSTVG